MITIDSNSFKVDEKEVTAYVQQQMVDLTPHLQEPSAIQVQLKKVNQGYEAELTAVVADGEIQTVGWNESLYEAIKSAKEGLLEYFVEVAALANPHQRDEAISHINRHGNLYLH